MYNKINTISLLILSLILSGTNHLTAQSTEVFETEATDATTFTDNGQNFTIETNEAGGVVFDIFSTPNGGWNGSSTDDKFIDNSDNSPTQGDGTSFTIKTTDGTDFTIKSLYLFVSNRTLSGPGTPTTLEFEGKKNGVTVFTVNKSSGIVDGSSFSPNNGFTFIDFSTEDGTDNSLTDIDEIVISSTNNADYLALDAFTWDAAVLPVELTYFEGYNTEDGVILEWETATETNNYGFQVQRKKIKDKSENEWEDLGFVQGNGTTNSPKNYEFADSELPNTDQVNYRLKQIDNDGRFEYSKTVTVDLTNITDVGDNKLPNEYSISQNYPNPFNPTTSIEYQVASSEKVELIVYNQLGEKVSVLVNEQKAPGFYEVQFEARNLASGIYFYKLTAGEFSQTKKLMLLK